VNVWRETQAQVVAWQAIAARSSTAVLVRTASAWGRRFVDDSVVAVLAGGAWCRAAHEELAADAKAMDTIKKPGRHGILFLITSHRNGGSVLLRARLALRIHLVISAPGGHPWTKEKRDA
jgi:hypothetical protein